MPEFLTLHTPDQALRIWFENLPFSPIKYENIPVKSALGRITAEDIIATEPLPPFTRSSVDGYAVQAKSTYGSSESLPTYLKFIAEVPMGEEPSFSIQVGEAALIHTGGMLPEGADAVVMLENTQVTPGGEVEIQKSVAVGENILQKGEDVQVGSVVLRTGKKIRPVEIGGMLALGKTTVKVTQKPAIGILSSGDEVVPPEVQPKYGQVRDINSYSLAALVEESGGEPHLFGILPDEPTALFDTLIRAFSEMDMVVITAGSSASTRDHTSEVINRLGVPGVLVHGINIRPGKPTILAIVNGKPLIGLPGNPISALVIARLFVVPMIERLLGCAIPSSLPLFKATMATNFPSVAGREDWIPIRLLRKENQLIADPIHFKSNFIFNLSQADGLALIPTPRTGVSAGEEVEVLPL